MLKKKHSTFVLLLLTSVLSQAQRLKEKLIDTSLPELQMTFLDNSMVSSDTYEGKPLMINFWSTECRPCIAEIPQLNKLRERYKDKVIFLAITDDTDKEAIKRTILKYGFKFDVVYNGKAIFSKLTMEGYPKNLFIDRYGFIRDVKEGTPSARKDINSEWEISVYDEYSIILDKLIR